MPIATYNTIITRTFIQNSILHDLLEAAQIDGCSDFRYLWSIVLPLSKTVIANTIDPGGPCRS